MKIGVLGAGSWGIALSLHLTRAGHEVRLWAHRAEKADHLRAQRANEALLPGVLLPKEVLISPEPAVTAEKVDQLLFAVPSHVLGEVARVFAGVAEKGVPVVCATKGLEAGTDLRMSEVLKNNFNNASPICVLSGPSHAEEVARKMPTTVVAASLEEGLARRVQEVFHSDYFRVYTSDDLLGVELAGALKNVIAIAAGISDGLGWGDNSKAAIMTRGLHEISRLGVRMGAQPATFSGLAGMGDLAVTCTSRHSRNRSLGEKLGKGLGLERALSEMVMVAEGVRTAKAAVELARRHQVDMPITQEVYAVLYEGKKAGEAARALLARSAKAEGDR